MQSRLWRLHRNELDFRPRDPELFYNAAYLGAECLDSSLGRKYWVLRQMARRVVKLGGSLLELPELIERFRAWLARQPAAATLLVVGGGSLVDAIRDAQAQHGFNDAAAHWLCIRAMAIQAEMLSALLPEVERPVSVADSRASPRELCLLDPWHFLRDEEPRMMAQPLPESWDVTSDSIAARAAEIAGADERVLLKSALPAHSTIAELSEAGYVDRFFPQAAAALSRIRFVNLREKGCPEAVIAIRR